ncbi:MAG: rod shape-determining protein RodA [Desulfovibrionaceae bacterium]|nr:rod shape-determining protein RodA [Desulfovibrionaceae bacterium]
MDNRQPLLRHLNWVLLAAALALFAVGEVNLVSASGTRLESGLAQASFYQRQLLWGVLGLCCMTVTMCFDYHRLLRLSWYLYGLTLVLLILVPLIGTTVYGAKRWISLGLFSIQPSELAKFAILLTTAKFLSSRSETLGWKDFGLILLMAAPPLGFIVKQPDLGSALMLLFIAGGMVLFHGLKASVLRICALAIPCIGAFMWFVGMHDYQRQRILTFLNPEADPLGSGYHILQSRIAIGSGQLWGKGFAEGTQSQLRFLPERHSDFAVAVFGEEWGFVGCLVLISLFVIFLLAILTTIIQAKDRFGSMLCVGVFFYFFAEISINMGMVVGLMPVVGIPLPFISYGGSATIVNFILIGLVLNVSMRRRAFRI